MTERQRNTLFITDLDGTLLTPDKTLSPKTVEILNRLIGQGMRFSVATARSAASTVELLRPLRLSLPVVLMNGVMLYDLQNRRYLSTHALTRAETEDLLTLLRSQGKTPFLYRLEDQRLSVEFERLDNPEEEAFYTERAGLVYKRFQQVKRLDAQGDAPVVYLTMIDTRELLEPIFRFLCEQGRVAASLYQDNYSDMWYLEIYSKKASKRAGALEVRARCGASRMVAFGDNYNDMGLLEAADEGYAVENAQEALRRMAHGVIGGNREDGVAKFLQDYWSE